VVVKSNGYIYFTDPPYGLPENVDDPTKEIPFQGVYRVSAKDGSVTLGAGRVFLDLTDSPDPGVPDGLKVDQRGNLWATGPSGVLIISPEGKHLGTLATGEAESNCAWDEDGSTLSITAHKYSAACARR
jgi:gluconolactonase